MRGRGESSPCRQLRRPGCGPSCDATSLRLPVPPRHPHPQLPPQARTHAVPPTSHPSHPCRTHATHARAPKPSPPPSHATICCSRVPGPNSADAAARLAAASAAGSGAGAGGGRVEKGGEGAAPLSLVRLQGYVLDVTPTGPTACPFRLPRCRPRQPRPPGPPPRPPAVPPHASAPAAQRPRPRPRPRPPAAEPLRPPPAEPPPAPRAEPCGRHREGGGALRPGARGWRAAPARASVALAAPARAPPATPSRFTPPCPLLPFPRGAITGHVPCSPTPPTCSRNRFRAAPRFLWLRLISTTNCQGPHPHPPTPSAPATPAGCR
jgi:hypothetical protein